VLGAAPQVRSTLNGVLSNMLGLAPLVGRLNDEVRAALLWAEERAAAAAAATAAGRWGVVGGDAEARRDEEVAPELLEVGGGPLDPLGLKRTDLNGPMAGFQGGPRPVASTASPPAPPRHLKSSPPPRFLAPPPPPNRSWSPSRRS
jgi:hypothetical protein